MAIQYTYKCLNCDFHIMTNDQGWNCNMHAVSYKYLCNKCHEIFSMSNPLTFRKPLEGDTTKLGYFRNKDMEIKVTDTCPLCGAKDSLSRWSPKDGCPKCGSLVIRDPKGLVILSD